MGLPRHNVHGTDKTSNVDILCRSPRFTVVNASLGDQADARRLKMDHSEIVFEPSVIVYEGLSKFPAGE